MIPFTNAVLSSIAGGGSAEDYDTAAGAPTARWTGTLGVYVAEELQEAVAGGGLAVTEVVTDRVEIPHAIGQLVQRGDTLTFTYEDVVQTRKARDIIRSAAVGRVRVLLEDA